MEDMRDMPSAISINFLSSVQVLARHWLKSCHLIQEVSTPPSLVDIRNMVPMFEDQIVLLHRSLSRSLADIRSKAVTPEFLALFHRPDWIIVICENHSSLDCLMSTRSTRPCLEATHSYKLNR